MTREERAARIARAKALGRIAFLLARNGEIFGNMEVEGEAKRITDFQRGRLLIELAATWRAGAFETEFSRLRVSWAGARVLELRWDRAGFFNVVLFKLGEWEQQLRHS